MGKPFAVVAKMIATVSLAGTVYMSCGFVLSCLSLPGSLNFMVQMISVVQDNSTAVHLTIAVVEALVSLALLAQSCTLACIARPPRP